MSFSRDKQNFDSMGCCVEQDWKTNDIRHLEMLFFLSKMTDLESHDNLSIPPKTRKTRLSPDSSKH